MYARSLSRFSKRLRFSRVEQFEYIVRIPRVESRERARDRSCKPASFFANYLDESPTSALLGRVLSRKVICTRSAAVASLESILPVSYRRLAPPLLASSIVSIVFDVSRRIAGDREPGASAAENQRASGRKRKETGREW